MPNKWQITIIITDLKGRWDVENLRDDVRDKWLPPSHDLILESIKIGLIESKKVD